MKFFKRRQAHNDNPETIEGRNEYALTSLQRRLIFAIFIILFFFCAISARLWFLQVSNGEIYKKRAQKNRIRVRTITPPRGHILDRKGREIVTNRPSFNVILTREDSSDIAGTLKKLAPILSVSEDYLWGKVREASGTPLYLPITLKKDIDWQTLAYLEYNQRQFAGVRTEVQPVRVYPYIDLAANIIGYLGSISKKELNARKDELDRDGKPLYLGGDIIGKKGLEAIREADLRGEKGKQYTEVDARGFEQKRFIGIKPLPGRDIQLTIDADVQQVAENFMNAAGKSGAAVVMEINTGKVLAAVSTPSIHIEDFVGGISHKKWRALQENPQHPLLNKVVQGTYPPGSTYKMVTALAGLARGAINNQSSIYCAGKYRFGSRSYRCWKRAGHGPMTLRQALGQSCDVYFYQVGQRVGVDTLAKFAKKLGLGSKTGIEMEYEKAGIVPTKDWKMKRYKKKWQNGETLSVAIGQGANAMTPLQIAVMTATIANGGTRYRPQIVEKVTDSSGNVIERFRPEIVEKIHGYDKYFALIRAGMREVIQGRRGTARKLRIKGLEFAGKTGTAQVVKIAQYKGLKDEKIPYKYRDHAWFTCYAPADKPEIVVTVLVEHGLHGGSGAGPVARAILQQYFATRLGITPETAPEEKTDSMINP